MDADFWHKKWRNDEIAFHENEANPLLVKYLDRLCLNEGNRVFVPLCGKTGDIHWLLSEGYRIAGAELSKLAIEQLFQEIGLQPQITQHGEVELYSAECIDIFAGDIFCLTRELLGPVDAVYDRAAIVALPLDVRKRYAGFLVDLTNSSQQLIISYEYDQNLMMGPPFSVETEEIHKLYEKYYDVVQIERKKVAGGIRGTETTEKVWLLKTKP